jgi:predicted DNA-binding antitoxin AbrB/MazE fold protein
MRVATYEATVENGQIKMSQPVRLPEHARVYVVVPGVEESPRLAVRSPRLARPEQMQELVKEVIEDGSNAGLS